MTLARNDTESLECSGGALHEDGSDVSRSVAVNGLPEGDLVVDLYAARDCSPKSWLTQITQSDCYVSSRQVTRIFNEDVELLLT